MAAKTAYLYPDVSDPNASDPDASNHGRSLRVAARTGRTKSYVGLFAIALRIPIVPLMPIAVLVGALGLGMLMHLGPRSRAVGMDRIQEDGPSLEQRIEALVKAGNLESALPLAEELVEQRRATPEMASWRIRSAEVQRSGFQSILSLSPEARAEVEASRGWTSQWRELDRDGLYREAEQIAEQQWRVRHQHLGPDHALTVRSLHLVANMRQKQGRLAEAEAVGRRVVEQQRKLYGEGHPRTLAALQNLAWLLSSRGQREAGEALLKRAITTADDSLGSHHMIAIAARINLGLTLDQPERWTEAKTTIEEAIELANENFGEESFLTLNALDALANVESRLGQVDLAVSRLEELKRISIAKYGSEHPQTLARERTLASLLLSAGRVSDAQVLLEQLLPRQRQALGAIHLDTIHSHRLLATALYRLGNLQQASDQLDRAILDYEQARVLVTDADLERSYFDSFNSPWALRAMCQAQLGDPSEAWIQLEASHARGLRDALERRRSRPLTRDERRREAQLVRELEVLETELARAPDSERESKQRERERIVAQRVEWERQLASRYDEPKIGDLASDSSKLTLDDLRSALPPGSAFVSWVTDPMGQVHAFVLAQDADPSVIPLPGSGEEGRWTAEDRKLIADLRVELARESSSRDARGVRLVRKKPKTSANGDPLESWRNLSDRVRERYWTPVDAQLPDSIEQIVVLPSRPLEGVPLGTIVRDRRVSYSPSVAILKSIRDRRRSGFLRGRSDGCVAFGDPISTPSSRPPEIELTLASATLTGVVLRAPIEAVESVSIVERGAPSVSVGPRAGDTILRVGETRIEHSNQFESMRRTLLTQQQPISIEWLRGSQRYRGAVHPRVLAQASVSTLPVSEARREVVAFQSALETRQDPRTPLPFARFEVAALELLYRTKHTHSGPPLEGFFGRSGELASEAEIERLRPRFPNTSVLHFATHAVVDQDRPMRSALLLASPVNDLADPTRDGRVTAEEIRRSWQLDADLVTLSACHTGLTSEAGSEGFLGFSQALFLAGARTLVLSLWKVDDRATALLMTRFYSNWMIWSLDKNASLREAQEWLRSLTEEQVQAYLQSPSAALNACLTEKTPPQIPMVGSTKTRPFAHPYYWGAFVIVGDPE